jgi:hypothetical protein
MKFTTGIMKNWSSEIEDMPRKKLNWPPIWEMKPFKSIKYKHKA